MARHAPPQWIAHLRSIAGPVAEHPPRGLGPLETPFLAVACGAAAGAAPQPLPPYDAALWWALLDPRIDVDKLIEGGDGPLWPAARARGLEVWTETELCGLHALWALGRGRGRDDLARRAEDARLWHQRHTQPDNATGRPWALHVFLLAGDAEAYHYAETLLHNALAGSGRPDLLSAWILLDAADRIEAVTRDPCTAGGRPPPRR